MTYTVTLRLLCTPRDIAILNKRFDIAKHIQNVLVKEMSRCLRSLKKDPEYYALLKQYRNEKDKDQKKQIGQKLFDLNAKHNVTKSHLEQYVKIQQHMFSKNIDSQAAQKIALRVWKGTIAVLFGDGENLHYVREVHSIEGKQAHTGIRYVNDGMEWNKLIVKCADISDNEWLVDAVAFGVLKYCTVKRRMFNDGWHYYLQLTMGGIPPAKEHKTAEGRNGIDIGTSTAASVSDHGMILEKLAPESGRYNARINTIQQYMDRSRRQNNPDNYNANGTVKKGKRHWKKSKGYRKAERQLKAMHARKAAYIRYCHECLANRILENGSEIITEEMNFKGLQKKSKAKAEKSKRTKNIKGKKVNMNKRKKRFGKSLNNKAPSELMEIIERKLSYSGRKIRYVDTWRYRASQYHHDTGEYRKPKLSERWKIIDGIHCQRDLYSAWLLKNAEPRLIQPDQELCKNTFSTFVNQQNTLISNMKQNHISAVSTFGF